MKILMDGRKEKIFDMFVLCMFIKSLSWFMIVNLLTISFILTCSKYDVTKVVLTLMIFKMQVTLGWFFDKNMIIWSQWIQAC